jgi:two-component system cell cycle response regulator
LARGSVTPEGRGQAPAPGREAAARKCAVLVIEDSPAHRAELRRALETHPDIGEITEAEDGVAGLRALLTRSFDAVICDLELPGFDGEKLLAVKEQRPELADTPVLFVSANRDPARKARLLERGASDTLEKPFHPAELLARLGVHLRLLQLRNELREKNQQLERLSVTDALTGLRNRRFAEWFLAGELERSRRHGNPLSVLLADLDHFKRVNDTHGHAAGDNALRHVATLLAQQVRKTDVCARWGGEEFLVGLAQVPLEGALALAERQRAAVEASPLVLPSGARLALTVSIGVAGARAIDGECPDGLVAAADRALYEAKDRGRNRVVLAKR